VTIHGPSQNARRCGFGSNNELRKGLTIDFRADGGRDAASPRLGGVIGISLDF
jgi:hypothetical protein